MLGDSETALAHRYVFVGGLHRSGTTLIAQLLASGSNATGLADTGVTEDEGHFLHDVTDSAIEHGGPGRFAFNPAVRLGSSRTPHKDRARMETSWAGHWDNPSAPVRVEKSPQHLLELPFLDSVFPGSRHIVVLRHPITVALATRKWTRPGPPKLRRLAPRMPLENLVSHWLHAHHLFEQDSVRVDKLTVVRYEDFVNEPGQTLETLATTAGIEGTIDTSTVRRGSGRYQELWDTYRRSAAGRRAAHSWLPMAETAMARWGYSADDELL